MMAEMTPLQFKKIKNSLFNGYSIAERGRFSYLIGDAGPLFWKKIGEKDPVPSDLSINNEQKKSIILERLELEPSPKRFIEICNNIAWCMQYVSVLPQTYDTKKYQKYTGSSLSLTFLTEICWEFNGEYGDIVDKTLTENGMTEYILTYTGNDFCQAESDNFIINEFKSKVLADILKQNNQVARKKKGWLLSKISFKIKPPLFEVGAEVKKK